MNLFRMCLLFQVSLSEHRQALEESHAQIVEEQKLALQIKQQLEMETAAKKEALKLADERAKLTAQVP